MITIESTDGTPIAYERRGSGPPVVLVGGAFNDRDTVAGLAEALAASCTAYTYDRRGRGDSGDKPAGTVHTPEREVEDLAAVIAVAGGTAAVVGHSSGAVLALEAAAAGAPISRLAVYEPSYIVPGTRPQPPADLAEQISSLVTDDRRDDAVALFLTEAAGVPAEAVAGMRQAPFWSGMTALAHTLPYDVALHGPRQSMPTDRLRSITAPTLVLHGDATDDYLRAAAEGVGAVVPGAQLVVVPGQDHGVLHHPQALVPLLVPFLTGDRA
jgi:pimeloyl-ACP methyl ester carboxylesterase